MRCAHCQSNFSSRKKTARYCSNACKSAARERRTTVICQHCGTGFDVKICESDTARFCSRSCKGMASRRPLTPEAVAAAWLMKVRKGGTNDCWLWDGPQHREGYGMLRIGKTSQRTAHRVSYEIHHGSIPAGIQVCHRCDVRLCVNPDHLFLGTHQDNQADKVAKGRQSRGETRPKAKLTEAKVRAIRSSSESNAALARAYSVDASTIFEIRARKRWKHVD